VRRTDNRTTFYVSIVLKSGSLKLLEPSGPVQTCTGIALPLSICATPSNSKIPAYHLKLFARFSLEMVMISRSFILKPYLDQWLSCRGVGGTSGAAESKEQGIG